MTFELVKARYYIVRGDRVGVARAESHKKYTIQFGADGPFERHWKRDCEEITEREFDDYLNGRAVRNARAGEDERDREVKACDQAT